jgi:hypothetical protein
MGALGSAAAMAAIFFNIPGLILAIALVGTATFVQIPQIRGELDAYANCRGQNSRGSMRHLLDVLSQLAGFIGIGSFVVALASLSGAVLSLVSIFGSWAAPALIQGGQAAQYTGVVACIGAILILGGVISEVETYRSCRDAEDRAKPPSGSGASLTEAPREPLQVM